MQKVYFNAIDQFPYDENEYLEIKPGVRVPTDDWEGYQWMAQVFFDDFEDQNNLARVRRALAVHNQVRVDIVEGEKIDQEEVQETLANILLESSPEASKEKEKKAIIHGVKTTTGKSVRYMVEQSDGEDVLCTKYELKRKYPDTWQQMVREYQEINAKAREVAQSDSLYSSKLEDEIEDGGVKNNPEIRPRYMREEEMHQGSTMMWSPVEKKQMHGMEPESHGEAGLHKYDNDLMPKPASVYAEHNGDIYRKRLSEPLLVGQHRPLMYSPQVGRVTPNTEIPAKRYRPSMELQPPMDVPFISPAQTDTAATAWNLLSKIMGNENRLIAALEEQKSRNAYLEKLVVEGGGSLVALNEAQTSVREAELVKVVEGKEEELQTLKSLLRKSSEEQEARLQTITGLEEKLKDANETIQSMETESAESIAKLQKAEEDLKKLEEESKQHLAESSEQIQNLQLEVKEKKETITQMTGDLANLELDLKKNTSEYKKLEKLAVTKEKRFKKELSSLESSQNKEVKKLADALLKVRVEKDREEEKMKENEDKLKTQLNDAKKKFQEAMDAMPKENRNLRARRPSPDDVDISPMIQSAMDMQKEARNTLDLLKRGNSLEITSFYDNVEFDGTEDSQDMGETNKWLHPSHWKNCTIVGAKKVGDTIMYKCLNSQTNKTAYMSSADMRKRQFCLLPMLQFIESSSLSTTSSDTSS